MDKRYRFSGLEWLSTAITITLAYKFFRYNMSRIVKNDEVLVNKVVLITGASSGIGEAAAHKFFAKRCKLVLVARRLDELERVKRDLLKNNIDNCVHEPLVMKLDLEDINSMPSIIDYIIKNVGEIDILINNAGVSSRGKVMETEIEIYKKIMNVNFFGQIAFTKAVLKHMIPRKRGHILFVSSFQGKYCLPNRSAYGASKHALQTFTENLRTEMQRYNIKVSVVYPPYVNTALSMNAIMGNGEKYGITDQNTATGESTDVIADDIVKTIIEEKKEFTRSPLKPHIYHYSRTIWPSLYFRILTKLQNEADMMAKAKL